MIVTPFDDYTGDVRAIEVRVAPIDVGFDLRTLDTPVSVPEHTIVASYEYGGRRMVVEGTRDEICATLRDAGYRLS